jgi:L-threonylcarbamoyladenylate synthase
MARVPWPYRPALCWAWRLGDVMLLDARDPQAIVQAAQALAEGRLLGLPTETVYGLGARADSDDAVAAIFKSKGRPSGHPLIVHVADVAGAQAFAAHWPAMAQRLAQRFWPGPLTVIVERKPGVATTAAGGHSTIGLRCPGHDAALSVLKAAHALGVGGVAAPSANAFGRISPTTAQHVVDEFGPELMVLDAGACAVGIESTIVDCSGTRPVLLRPGMLSREVLEQALGVPLQAVDAQTGEHTTPAPGTLDLHYAPKAKLRLMPASALQAGWHRLEKFSGCLAVYARHFVALPQPGLIYRMMPQDADKTAQELFATLRAFDTQGATLIWVEIPPSDAPWDGVRDRLRRASQN